MFEQTVRIYNDCSDYTLQVKIESKSRQNPKIVEIQPCDFGDLLYDDVCEDRVVVSVMLFKKNGETYKPLYPKSFKGVDYIRFYQRGLVILEDIVDGAFSFDRMRIPWKVGQYLKMMVIEGKNYISNKFEEIIVQLNSFSVWGTTTSQLRQPLLKVDLVSDDEFFRVSYC
ncbi:hypothetical protein CsatB_022232 [Cannabis sativa]